MDDEPGGPAVTGSTARPPTDRLAVLMYHAVGTAMPPALSDLSVPPALLAEHLGALTAAGYRLVGLSEALAARADDRTVALTFDDGYLDVVDVVAPLLDDAGARATLYVPTRHLGRRAAWLPAPADRLRVVSPAQVADLALAGVEIGSHGAVHVPMDVLPPVRARAELRESRDRLEQVTGRPVVSMCYPHGYASRRLARDVAACGYRNACAIGHRLHRLDADPHRVARIMVRPSTSSADLLRLVAHGPAPLVPRLKQTLDPAWRAARRAALLTTGSTWT